MGAGHRCGTWRREETRALQQDVHIYAQLSRGLEEIPFYSFLDSVSVAVKWADDPQQEIVSIKGEESAKSFQT